MATSGSVDYNRTAKQLVKSALRGIGVLQSGEAPSHEEMQDSLEALEMMIKSLQGVGYHLWTYSEATLFLTKGTASYSISGDRVVSNFAETTTTADASSTDTTITVSSITGIYDGDTIGILDGDEIFWTTVNGAPSGSTVTLTNALTSDIDSGAAVYAYTATDDLINRPLRIQSARRRVGTTETPMEQMGRVDYFDLPNKDTEGVPTQFYYDPGLSTGTIYVWPAPESEEHSIKLNYTRPIEDFDATSNNPDLPQEWLETLKYQLMLRLTHEYGVVLKPEIAQLAGGLLETMQGWDTEPASVYFQPDYR